MPAPPRELLAQPSTASTTWSAARQGGGVVRGPRGPVRRTPGFGLVLWARGGRRSTRSSPRSGRQPRQRMEQAACSGTGVDVHVGHLHAIQYARYHLTNASAFEFARHRAAAGVPLRAPDLGRHDGERSEKALATSPFRPTTSSAGRQFRFRGCWVFAEGKGPRPGPRIYLRMDEAGRPG